MGETISKQVVVLACSGIGKTFGSVSREAAYDLCEELRPESTRLVALAKLVLGEPGARELVAKHPAVTIDGCKQMCAAKMAMKENPMEKAGGHSKDCALDDHCAGSGYGIFSDGKFYKFDEKGSARAKELIEKSKREKGLFFEAKGTVGDGTMMVTSLKEATPPKPKMMKKGT